MSKGSVGFILGLSVFLAFMVFLTTQIQPYFPEYQAIESFDMVVFGGSFIAIAGACSVATGLLCAGALTFFLFGSFFLVQNTLIYSLIFVPVTVSTAYIFARLAQGGG